MKFLKPSRLKEGDTVAVLSPSKGLPSNYPQVYELGIRNLEEKFGLKVKEYQTARADRDFLYNNPMRRAEDVNKAFEDKEVKGIIASIGGEESVRILPYLNRKAIQANPKILMGFSDITTLLTYCNELGLVTFYGPMVMAGFSQIDSLPAKFTYHVRQMLFRPKSALEYEPYEVYSEGYPEWALEENLGKVKATKRSSGWNWLQGRSVVQGELFGGCIEVLEWMKGTEFWPRPDFWKGKILFFETSEEIPSVLHVERWLRNYGVQRMFEKVRGILFGRARGYSDEEKRELDQAIVSVVAKEFGRPELPVVSNIDFGHTDPNSYYPWA
jgi:muramoyltetrapeptide carboxypeptidase LdcA involved in peptidoglycan recycling